MDGYIMWPLTTTEGEKWIVEQVLGLGEFEPVKEFDSEEEASVWIKARICSSGGRGLIQKFQQPKRK